MGVSILLLRALVEAVEHGGVPREAVFEAAGFDAERINDSDERLTLDEWNDLQEHALNLTGDEALGLRMGEMANVSTYNLAAHLVAHATTLREGLAALLKFHRLLSDRPSWGLEEDDRTATLRYIFPPASFRVQRMGAELTLTGFFRMVRYFDRGAAPIEVAFEYEAPECQAEYARVFEGFERFRRPFTGIVIERALLGAAQLNQDREFHRVLQAQAERRAARIERQRTYVERVRDYLTDRESRDFSMEGAARALGLSTRSLRRRLTEEGSSFGEIADDARARIAKRLITEECTIQEATYALGFADPSAFHRAFKRWTGMTPREYRSRH